MEALKKLIAKKKASGGELSPVERKAKSSVLSHLMDDMDSMDADKISGLKKVTVAAPDKSGLEHGLKMASDLVDKGPLKSMDKDDVSDLGDEENFDEPKDEHEPESLEDESAESTEEESAEGEQKAPEEMDEHELADHIEQLKKLHQSKKHSFGM